MEEYDVIYLEEYRVVAVPGEGPAVVDEDGNCWYVGGDSEDTESDNKLERSYARAVYGD